MTSEQEESSSQALEAWTQQGKDNKENVMVERAALAAAVAGGYVLGRTKKGKQAFRVVMWLNGNRPTPPALAFAQQATTQVASSKEAEQILGQIRGPLMEAVQRAALAAVAARAGRLAQGLEERTAALNEVAGAATEQAQQATGQATEQATDTASDAAGLVWEEPTSKSRKKGTPKDKEESQSSEDGGDQPESSEESSENQSPEESEPEGESGNESGNESGSESTGEKEEGS